MHCFWLCLHDAKKIGLECIRCRLKFKEIACIYGLPTCRRFFGIKLAEQMNDETANAVYYLITVDD